MDTNEWGLVTKLIAADAPINDFFGQDVGINSEWALVGADRDDVNNRDVEENSGSAYYFGPPKEPTMLTYTGPTSIQYSDELALTALLLNEDTGEGVAGETINFSVGGQTISAVTNADGLASTTLIMDQDPSAGCASDPVNDYELIASFDETVNYLGSGDTLSTFPIAQEDARATYTGATMVSTASLNSGEAEVLLSVTVQDISATADAGGDHSPGDVSLATVDFLDEDGNAINPAPVPVTLIDPSDPTTGIATYNWTDINIGNADAQQFVVGVRVCGYYSRGSTEDDVVITVSKPQASFVTGGGYLNLQNSVGQLAGDTGTKQLFGFVARYNKGKDEFQGNLLLTIHRTEADGRRHTYLIIGDEITSLAIDEDNNEATFFGKASVMDVTYFWRPVQVANNVDFLVQLQDNGEPGYQDLIGFSAYDEFGSLLYSNNWSGNSTELQALGGGNIQIHSKKGYKNSLASRKPNWRKSATESADDNLTRSFTVFPVPTDREITVNLDFVPATEVLNMHITNLQGRLVKQVANINDRQRIDLSELPAGIYLLHLSDGQQRLQTQRIVKH